MDKIYYSMEEAARETGVPYKTIWRWCDSGIIMSPIRIGSIRLLTKETLEAIKSKRRENNETKNKSN